MEKADTVTFKCDCGYHTTRIEDALHHAIETKHNMEVHVYGSVLALNVTIGEPAD